MNSIMNIHKLQPEHLKTIARIVAMLGDKVNENLSSLKQAELKIWYLILRFRHWKIFEIWGKWVLGFG